MRPYERLADDEFEELIGDLLGTEEDRTYERFRRGADLGIDLRHIDGDEVKVIQCKHYRESSFSKLKTAARKEVGRLEQLDPPPTSYRFVTSRSLTPANKDKLAEILQVWVEGPQDVLGGGDVDALLDRHGAVERRHVKLWLPGGTALAALLNSDVYSRSRALLERIDRVLPLYVQTSGFLRAHDKLSEEQVCVISGPPGIGKTTLAQMLVADAIKQEFEPIEVSRNIEEAWRVFDSETPQIFYYDDFLGTTTLGELEKNEDQSLVNFIAAVASRPNALFVLTTREYIFKQARALYESFERAGVDSRKFLLTLSDYGRMERAKILYNHVFHAPNLPDEARHSLIEDDGYLRVVDHRLFTPRLIETITASYGPEAVAEGSDFVDYAVSVLDDPEFIWRRVYENHISDRERTLLQALVSMPLPAQIDDLRAVYLALAEERNLGVEAADFETALEILDDSLIATNHIGGKLTVDFINPSVEDFLRGRLAGAPAAVKLVVETAIFFDQMRRVWTLFDPETIDDDLVAAMAARCLNDLFETDSAVWARMDIGFRDYRLTRGPRNLELRLEFVIELVGDREGEEFDRLRAAAADCLETFREKWRRGEGTESGAFSLVRAVRENASSLTVPDGIYADLKTLLVEQAATPEDYRRLLEFREAFPELFTEEEMIDIADRFRIQAEEDLTYNVDTITSEEELHAYSIMAEELGVELDEQLVETASKEVAQAQEQAEMAYERYDEERGSGASFGTGAEQAAIDTLFSRLAD